MKNGFISEQFELQNQNLAGEKKKDVFQPSGKENNISYNLDSKQENLLFFNSENKKAGKLAFNIGNNITTKQNSNIAIINLSYYQESNLFPSSLIPFASLANPTNPKEQMPTPKNKEKKPHTITPYKRYSNSFFGN